MPSLVARLGTNHSRMRLAVKRWVGVARIPSDRIRQTNWERRTDLVWIAFLGICT
jgi:hypothetical protein